MHVCVAGDMWDEDELKNTTTNQRLSTVYVLTGSDGCVLKNTSYTPMVGQWMNTHPAHRQSFDGCLLFALFPLFRFVMRKLRSQNFLDVPDSAGSRYNIYPLFCSLLNCFVLFRTIQLSSYTHCNYFLPAGVRCIRQSSPVHGCEVLSRPSRHTRPSKDYGFQRNWV